MIAVVERIAWNKVKNSANSWRVISTQYVVIIMIILLERTIDTWENKPFVGEKVGGEERWGEKSKNIFYNNELTPNILLWFQRKIGARENSKKLWDVCGIN